MPAEPLFTPLGYVDTPHCEVRYAFLIRGQVKLYRTWELFNQPTLLTMIPDHKHWSRNFPSRTYHGNRIDTGAAGSALLQSCLNAGPYDPPPELRPKNGRPKKSAQ
jgi:hypothetical protein